MRPARWEESGFGLPRRWRRTLGAAPSRLRRYTSGGRRDRRLPSSPFVVARIGHGRYSALRSRTRRRPLIIVTSPSPTSPTRRLSRSSTPARISSTWIGRPPPVRRQPDSGQAEGSRATAPAEWTSSEGKPPQTAKEQPSWTCAESLLVNVRWDGFRCCSWCSTVRGGMDVRRSGHGMGDEAPLQDIEPQTPPCASL